MIRTVDTGKNRRHERLGKDELGEMLELMIEAEWAPVVEDHDFGTRGGRSGVALSSTSYCRMPVSIHVSIMIMRCVLFDDSSQRHDCGGNLVCDTVTLVPCGGSA